MDILPGETGLPILFTDDDLKRLKEHASLPTRDMIMISHNQALALLARLESAEKCVWWADYGATYIPTGNLDDCKEALEAWRKSAGRE